MFYCIFTRPLMGKLNFHGYSISWFYPTCQIRENFFHAKIITWFTVMGANHHHYSGACHRRVRCTSSRPVLCTLFCRRQTKVQWSRVVSDGSKSGLSGPANPPSPYSTRSQNASPESQVMILPGISAAQMTKKGQTRLQMVSDKAGCSVWERISSLVTKSVQCTFPWIMPG